MKKGYILLITLVMGCSSARQSGHDTVNHNITTHGKLFASLFQQRSGEYRALCFQAYNLAQLRLDQTLSGTHTKPLAIVTDIDETVLDNSPYDVKQSLAGKDYEQKSWEEWTSLAKADTIPGALSFFKYAASKGVRIFYLTNRAESERKGTLENLKIKGFPDATSEQLILKSDVSSKELRRQSIAERYEIALLIGDNLGDFSQLFDKKPEGERNSNVAGVAGDFGKKFIVLPNPVYGDWENTLYQFKYDLKKAQKDSVIRSLLKSY
ncbi:5'-nucleotidase, lipoprotein e(P4) family [Dyadobacter luteus]|uniref:5'-nucleotidase, lipoprotein e(P4) family n=1 Tax=Dyadobacter luteus TaxID=2259619 RepID=A0A3D8Y2P9_9BACT|nr:5'-nucleotidase, lipoprotein e(P4) family [Dyadobacter luteus]REA55971.1 5'-nucleotidase, lipoprotein e(P4) family [Dyadobacter luteus]